MSVETETLKARIRQIQQELDRLNAEKIELEIELKLKEDENDKRFIQQRK